MTLNIDLSNYRALVTGVRPYRVLREDRGKRRLYNIDPS
jgi:hypothetical protein